MVGSGNFDISGISPPWLGILTTAKPPVGCMWPNQAVARRTLSLKTNSAEFVAPYEAECPTHGGGSGVFAGVGGNLVSFH
jgi:hypothetical protein